MQLFISHAVMQAKGVVYKEQKVWEKGVAMVCHSALFPFTGLEFGGG